MTSTLEHASASRILWSALAFLTFAVSPLHAGEFGLLTYEVNDDESVTITDYPEHAVGGVVIPAEINGRLVTSIGHGTFSCCTGLTSIAIPDS